jgi:hypothetical protein
LVAKGPHYASLEPVQATTRYDGVLRRYLSGTPSVVMLDLPLIPILGCIAQVQHHLGALVEPSEVLDGESRVAIGLA